MTGNWVGIVHHGIPGAIRSNIGKRTRLHHQFWEGIVIVVSGVEIVRASCRLYNLGKHQRPLAHGVVPDKHALVVLIWGPINFHAIRWVRVRRIERRWGAACMGSTAVVNQPSSVPRSPSRCRSGGKEGDRSAELGRKACY